MDTRNLSDFAESVYTVDRCMGRQVFPKGSVSICIEYTKREYPVYNGIPHVYGTFSHVLLRSLFNHFCVYTILMIYVIFIDNNGEG